ncbi:MAG: T9SS type A sorting domain-containing protein [Balneolaceae bacterium]
MRLVISLLVTSFAFLALPAQAQSVISFSGGTLENSNMSLSFSAGEVIAGTFTGATINITGGFGNGSDLLSTSNEILQNDLPTVFRLNQNYPNPFNPSTNITFDLPKTAEVRLEVFNSIGSKVAVLAEGQKAAGTHTLRFDASYMASGMYFYRLTAAGNVISTKKMLLIK